MLSINGILVDTLSLESDMSLGVAVESLYDMMLIHDSRITLESFVQRLETANGVVDVLCVEQDYKDWLGDNGLSTIPVNATGQVVADDIKNTLAKIQNPSLESDLVQSLKRSFNSLAMNLKTFGKNLFDIKMKLKSKSSAIESAPVLLDSMTAYKFLFKDDKPVDKLVTCIDEDQKFLEACEKHYRELFEKSKELTRLFRSAATSKSPELIREAIDAFDEAIIDRQSFHDLSQFRLIGNRAVELDAKGYPRITQLQGKPAAFKKAFTKATDKPDSLTSMIAAGEIKGFSIGGAPTSAPAVSGLTPEEGLKKLQSQLQSHHGVVSMAEFMKVMDQAQAMNQETVRFAQMASQMSERVARMSDDLQDAYESTVDEETGKFDKVLYRELLDLYKAGRRTVSQYMFLGKIVATMMEDHASYVYRGVTTLANQVLSKTK